MSTLSGLNLKATMIRCGVRAGCLTPCTTRALTGSCTSARRTTSRSANGSDAVQKVAYWEYLEYELDLLEVVIMVGLISITSRPTTELLADIESLLI